MMRIFVLFIILVLLNKNILANAPEYQLNLERVEQKLSIQDLVRMNVSIVRISRNEMGINADFIILKDLNSSNNIMVRYRLYNFRNNEYRPFAIDVKRDLCSFFEIEYKTFLYSTFKDKGKVMPPTCPIKKGNYYVAHWKALANKFPLLTPTKYMLQISFSHNSVQIYFVNVYFTMDADAYLRDKYTE